MLSLELEQETDRQTDRQGDRQTERQTDRQRQTDRKTERQRQGDSQKQRQTDTVRQRVKERDHARVQKPLVSKHCKSTSAVSVSAAAPFIESSASAVNDVTFGQLRSRSGGDCCRVKTVSVPRHHCRHYLCLFPAPQHVSCI